MNNYRSEFAKLWEDLRGKLGQKNSSCCKLRGHSNEENTPVCSIFMIKLINLIHVSPPSSLTNLVLQYNWIGCSTLKVFPPETTLSATWTICSSYLEGLSAVLFLFLFLFIFILFLFSFIFLFIFFWEILWLPSAKIKYLSPPGC
jgi:hypothetical protein